jgi:hypothetical protein
VDIGNIADEFLQSPVLFDVWTTWVTNIKCMEFISVLFTTVLNYIYIYFFFYSEKKDLPKEKGMSMPSQVS